MGKFPMPKSNRTEQSKNKYFIGVKKKDQQ